MNTLNPYLSHPRATVRPQRGLSLIELMVAITIGMVVMAALLALYVNVSRTNNEMAKANRQIENGRFAIQILQGDVIHAGFWGRLGYSQPPAPAFAAPSAVPDPCVTVGWSAAHKTNLLAIPVQGYADDSTLGAGCKVSGLLDTSDVMVIRHANTCTAGSAGCDGGSDTGPHIQVSACQNGSPAPEAAYAIDAAAFPLREKDCATIAARRKVISNIYYLAESNGQPTLMRAALTNGEYSNPQPLIEGIEAFRVEYGIDTLGRNGLAISATNPPDGSADEYVSCPAAGCTLAQLSNLVSAKIHVLARNLETTPGYTDTKTYRLGDAAELGPFDDGYKRHVFSTTVRLVNVSGRREIP
jgi:type IV pilus assembly protein PilW